ncbi:RNB domain-containing ribonuclease [Dietzia sp. 179-F 9C3 NHS]|uniref:RNB domain-containing ribonuclease n=1 Tax=Dietzia sp. 179-F 9C3 NHS TaxID=3374295 RepID=UPI00387A420F
MATMTALMIDGAGSLDRDDAVTVTEDEYGWDATVYVAAVADAIPVGSPEDRVALSRVHTLYLRNEVRPMLGRELEAAATLSPTEPRPALSIAMRFAPNGELFSSEISRAFLPAGDTIPYTHQQVGAALSPDSDDPEREQIHAAYRLARTLIAGRRAAGAFAVFDALRGMITSEEGRLVALPSNQVPAAYLIVQELMVAANATLARWAIGLDLPILFRNHARSAVAPPAGDLLADINAELSAHPAMGPDDVQALTTRINQTLRPATYQPVARGHFGLQLPAYAHATSPLRRYADLVTQRQVLAHIDGAEPPYTPAELDDLAETINRTVRKQSAQKSAAASATRRRQATTTIAAGDYSRTHGRDWLRVLRIAADTALPDGLAAELRRRAEAGDLDGGQLAVIMRATGQGWTGLLEQILATAQQLTPQYAASAISAWNQNEETPHPSPELDYRQSGPPHLPTFTAQVTFAGVTSSWTTGASKKLAERQALWELVEILAGVRAPATPTPPPAAPDAGPDPQRPATPAAAEPAQLVDLQALSGREWLRTARALIADPAGCEDELADELRRRAAGGDLEAPVVAALLADDTGRWRPLLGELVATLRATAPHSANSVLSVWQQLADAPAGSPEMQVRQFGQPHAPVFAIRAHHEQWLTRWHSSTVKKAAMQQALWELVGVIAGFTPAGSAEDEPEVPEPPARADQDAPASADEGAPRAVAPSPTPPPASSLPSTPADVTNAARPLAHTDVPELVRQNNDLAAVLGATPTDRARKYRNAVKSPTAWINNLAAALHSGAPHVDTAPIDGGFTTTITITTPVGELTDTGAGTNQKTARAAASLALVQRLFAIT